MLDTIYKKVNYIFVITWPRWVVWLYEMNVCTKVRLLMFRRDWETFNYKNIINLTVLSIHFSVLHIVSLKTDEFNFIT